VRPPPSEASSLDERIAADCARSGVPFHVTADHLVDRVADWLELALAALADQAVDHHPQPSPDRARRATGRHQGTPGDRGASANRPAVMTPGASNGPPVMTPSPQR
jgi:hypothetical protein